MKASSKSTLKKYWAEARRYKVAGWVIILTVIGGSATGAIIPLFVRDLFNSLNSSAPNKAATLFHILFFIGLLEFLRWLFWRIATFVNDYFQTAVLANLANQCFAYLHKHSFTFFNGNFVGSLVKRVNYYTRAFESLMDRFIWNILPLLVDFIIILTVLFSINHTLGFGIIVWIGIFMAVNFVFTAYKLKYDLARSEAETKSTGLLADTITNQGNVKLFVGYKTELNKFAQAVEKVRKLRRFTWDLNAWFEAVQGLLAAGLNLAVFYYAIKLSLVGQITIGDFVLMQTYLIMIFDRVWDFARIIRNIYTDLADADEMTVVLDTPHEVKDIPNASNLKVKGAEIIFDKVGFSYHADRKIFTDFSLRINSQEKVALVGPSGAGKSTVVKLLLRMHDVTSGQVTIDGQDISQVTQESLWKAVSLVPQDPILFHRSLLENIRYGRPEATDQEVVAAAKLAHCDEFINQFPEKYQTFVGERGVKLSGGERQRVAIARAILRNAPILILDEATSSLDSESEHLIQDALAKLMENKTVIVIAHRLSTIMKMDRIVVVEKGGILEQGTHQDLLNKETSLYKDLWKLQAGGFVTPA